MVAILDGWALGERIQNAKLDRERQTKQDAWESEQQARQKQIWDREDKTRSDADAAMRDDPSAGYTPVDPYAAFGIQRRAVPAPQAPVGEQYGSGSVGAPGLAPQAQMAFPETGGYAQQKQKLLQSQLAAARAQGGVVGLQQFQKTQSEMLASRMGEDAARIGHFVANAPEDEYQQLLSRVHVDKNNKYETTFDPKTKLTTLALGKESVQLSRADVGRYFEAMHRLKNGDSSAMGDLETIHKGLAAKVAEDLKLKEGMAKTNNDAFTAQSGRISANAAAQNAQTTAAYHGEQIKDFKDARDRREEAAGLQRQFDALTPTQQAGPEGLGLQRSFNMIKVKNGGQVNLGARGAGGASVLKRVVDQKPNDDGSYTAFDKATGEALYNTIHGEPIPKGMTVMEYTALKDAASKANVQLTMGENNGVLEHRFIGSDGQAYKTVKEAEKARPAKASVAATVTETKPVAGLKLPSTASGDLPKPAFYVGIERDSNQRTPGYTFRGNHYPTEQAALAAYYALNKGN